MKGVRLFRIFGIDVNLHFSWWFVFALLAWSLAVSFFPEFFPDLTVFQYWVMGVIASLLLFVSVLFHELSHSLVARAQKIRVESITLFFFGGVAGISREDMKPSSEFMMALAGPLFSFFLAGIFFLIYKLNGHVILTGITFYLYQLNFILAVFNLIPGFPLDGGRAFRAILYAYYKDLKKATRIAAAVGKFFAGFLVFLGFLGVITNSGVGLWFVLLGGFLWFLAGMSYEQVLIKEALSDIPLKELLNINFTLLNPEMTFSDFVRKYSFSEEEAFVVKNKEFVGILDLQKIKEIPSQMQSLVKLKQVALPLSKIKSAKKEDNAYTAFRKISEQNLEILPVVEGEKLVGIVSRRAVMHRLTWKMKYSGDLTKEKTKKHKK